MESVRDRVPRSRASAASPGRPRDSCSHERLLRPHGRSDDFDIDAKLNGAYIAVGLLYGERDPERTIDLVVE